MHERWQGLFGNYLTTSFVDILRAQSPEAFPPAAFQGWSAPSLDAQGPLLVPRGTTILALRYLDGVIVAGDRQATEGYQVAHRRIEKVYKADDHSAIAIAGAAGPSIEMARLFQTELEHYEKVEGDGLSLEGKANKLAQMIRMNLPAAMQGLVVVPIFAGFDLKRGEGRIFKYDITGGRYEETEYYATGSGGKDARTTLKKLYRSGCSRSDGVRMTAEALVDAAEEDVGTGGPDPIHGIYPSMKVITRTGFEEVPEAEVRSQCDAVLAARREANSQGAKSG
ncbi:MAG TPA: proteasome subunit beta [Methylomirabilota bacterium]|jgi:proteasome beta subunit|nr:proteasome subunit beta [Methylomirabilota bacterium]